MTAAHMIESTSNIAGLSPRALVIVLAPLLLAACSHPASSTEGLAWAYPQGSTTTFGQPLGPGPFRVPGSALVLTGAQVEEADGPIDWHPEDHPPAPRAVAGPPIGKATPCGECHLLNGAGFPASADLAGLPAAYIVEQVTAFRTGERGSANREQANTAEMIKAARAVSPAALEQAADYYSRLPRPNRLRVVEASTVPRTVPDKFGWLNPAPGGGTEPIGQRVVELSDDWPRLMIGDDHVRLTDYAPPGAIARGKRLAETGGTAGSPCQSCHGASLEGAGPAPPIAGRPAGYIARTLWDIRVGARHNHGVAPMQPIARRLTPSEITDLSAYLASLHA